MPISSHFVYKNSRQKQQNIVIFVSSYIYVYRFTYVCIASDLYVVNPKRTTCVVCETAAVM